MTTLPPAILPALLELEGRSPTDLAALFAAALELPDTPDAMAVEQVFRHAAKEGLDACALEEQLRQFGLGEGPSSAFALCWSTKADSRSLVQDAVGLNRLVDFDYTFGGARPAPAPYTHPRARTPPLTHHTPSALAPRGPPPLPCPARRQ